MEAGGELQQESLERSPRHGGKVVDIRTEELADRRWGKNMRGVTEKVHKYNGGGRTKEAWERRRKRENNESEAKRKRMKRSKLLWKKKPEERKLEKTIWDLTNFFIKIPRREFFKETMKKLMERIKEEFPGKEWF